MGKKTKNGEPAPKTVPGVATWWSYAALAMVVLFCSLIRVRLLDFPLERDEGEYAYAGQLMLHGVVPYKLCYSMKLPGTAAAYALFTALFGQTPAAVHLGLLLVNSASIVLVYFLARHLFGRLAGVVASAAFALLSIGPSVLGFAGHATQFVVLPAVGGILLLLTALESGRLRSFFWSGVSLGVAFLMKQPGGFFVLFAVFYLLYCERRPGAMWRSASRLGLLLLGAALPFAITCAILWRAGIFLRFWFWTFLYAREYGTIVTLSHGLRLLAESGSNVVRPAALIWLIAAAGAIAVLWSAKARTNTVFVLSLAAFSFASVCPGFYFRQHYFVLLLPVASLLCGVAVSTATSLMRTSFQKPAWAAIPALLFLLAVGISLDREGYFLFLETPVAACRRIYGHNPFPEALKIAAFVGEHSSANDRIAVVGSEPEIYFYANRRSATGYIYTYPLMEPQPFAEDMQREMESEIENANPRFVILVDVPLSWLAGPDSDQSIVSWANAYTRSHYQLVGVVDLLEQRTEYRWDADARTYQPQSPFRVLVFQRS